jgi:hypothetical protein
MYVVVRNPNRTRTKESKEERAARASKRLLKAYTYIYLRHTALQAYRYS